MLKTFENHFGGFITKNKSSENLDKLFFAFFKKHEVNCSNNDKSGGLTITTCDKSIEYYNIGLKIAITNNLMFSTKAILEDSENPNLNYSLKFATINCIKLDRLEIIKNLIENGLSICESDWIEDYYIKSLPSTSTSQYLQAIVALTE